MNDKDAIANAVAAGVVSGGVTLAVGAAIVAAFVMHPALGLTLLVGAIMFGATWLALALFWTAIKGACRWMRDRIGINFTRSYEAAAAPANPVILAQVETFALRDAAIVCAIPTVYALFASGVGPFAVCVAFSGFILLVLHYSMTTGPKLFGRVAATKGGRV